MSPLDRRTLLRLGAAGLASLALPRPSPATTEGGPPRNLVLLYAFGGWDPVVAIDPKPGVAGIASPDGDVLAAAGIDYLATAATPEVGRYFDRHAASTAVLRGLDMRSLSHSICLRYALTGRSDQQAPDMAAIAAHVHGAGRALPYLVIGDRALTGPLAASAGRTGATNQLGGLVDRSRGPAPLPELASDPAADLLVRDWVLGRVERARGRLAAGSQAERRYDELLDALERTDLLAEHADAFTPEEPSLEADVDLAVYALSSGLSRSVMLDSRANWDTHVDLLLQNRFFDQLFAGLGRLVDGLAAAPGRESGASLLDETLVVVLSEMGRTPLTNGEGGKEHWPYTSAMLVGAGVRGGRVYGATDDLLVGRAVDPSTGELDDRGEVVGASQLVAGILEAVGVTPAEWLPDTTPYRGPFAS